MVSLVLRGGGPQLLVLLSPQVMRRVARVLPLPNGQKLATEGLSGRYCKLFLNVALLGTVCSQPCKQELLSLARILLLHGVVSR